MKLIKLLLVLIAFFLWNREESNAGGFDDNVFVESASLVLVAESQSSLASIFGHSFLKIEGRGKVHALSYYNRLDSTVSSFIDVIIGKSEGFFSLLPYREVEDLYINKEKRSIWELKLDYTNEELLILKENIK